jgi:hypothetical protein
MSRPRQPGDDDRRRSRRHRIVGVIVGATAAVALGAAVFVWAESGESGQSGAPAATTAAPRPVRADIAPLTDRDAPAGTTAPATTRALPATAPGTMTAPATPAAPPRDAPPGTRPVVWVQAGHADPREPGYRDQTGAGSGPFGSEIAFTTRLAPLVVARLRRAGVDARQVPGMVEPSGAPGVAFVSLHHDSPAGAAAFGHAITGAGENYYHGEGSGDPSPVPYPDSAQHRAATTVPAAVESESRALAERLSARLRPVYTAANGAGGRFGGVQTREGNPRMMRYYGFYRTTADARVIVEAGAAGADDAFLVKTDLIASAVSSGIVDHLVATGRLD